MALFTPLKSIALDVEMTDVVACPVFVSTTAISDTKKKLEFMFSWESVDGSGQLWSDSDPECCSLTGQELRFIQPNIPVGVFTTHYINPDGQINQDLVNQITQECPMYIGSGDIWTSPCDTKLTTSSGCSSKALLVVNNDTNLKTAVKEEAVGFQELIRHKDDASFKLKSGNDAMPLFVKDELFVSNEKFNKNPGVLPFTIDDKFKEKYQQFPYVEQTKIKEILLQQGCKIISSFFITSNVLDTPAVSYELSCPNGNVIVTENALTKIQKHIQQYNNEIRLENNLVAGLTFYKNSQGMRNSYIITRNDKTQLRIMIIHGDNSQKDWLVKTANSAMPVD